MAGKKGQKHGPKKNISLFETAKSRTQKREVMYDPYNFAAVSEKFFREEKEAKEKAKLEKKAAQAKERASKLKVKKLEKSTVTGPLGGKIKIKTLKKITGGAPGLDRGIRSKMYIGKKMNMGGVMKNRGGTFKGVY